MTPDRPIGGAEECLAPIVGEIEGSPGRTLAGQDPALRVGIPERCPLFSLVHRRHGRLVPVASDRDVSPRHRHSRPGRQITVPRATCRVVDRSGCHRHRPLCTASGARRRRAGDHQPDRPMSWRRRTVADSGARRSARTTICTPGGVFAVAERQTAEDHHGHDGGHEIPVVRSRGPAPEREQPGAPELHGPHDRSLDVVFRRRLMVPSPLPCATAVPTAPDRTRGLAAAGPAPGRDAPAPVVPIVEAEAWPPTPDAAGPAAGPDDADPCDADEGTGNASPQKPHRRDPASTKLKHVGHCRARLRSDMAEPLRIKKDMIKRPSETIVPLHSRQEDHVTSETRLEVNNRAAPGSGRDAPPSERPGRLVADAVTAGQDRACRAPRRAGTPPRARAKLPTRPRSPIRPCARHTRPSTRHA